MRPLLPPLNWRTRDELYPTRSVHLASWSLSWHGHHDCQAESQPRRLLGFPTRFPNISTSTKQVCAETWLPASASAVRQATRTSRQKDLARCPSVGWPGLAFALRNCSPFPSASQSNLRADELNTRRLHARCHCHSRSSATCWMSATGYASPVAQIARPSLTGLLATVGVSMRMTRICQLCCQHYFQRKGQTEYTASRPRHSRRSSAAAWGWAHHALQNWQGTASQAWDWTWPTVSNVSWRPP